ncbi:DUF6924 domain-containing protein [Streptomyces sp. NPDC090798]|uniref:DUF6924 domain-containing protein n=1 Tax=Streptomyces sp. NPDC090798 TaxID=3365968 RepID=UPI003827F32B
MDLPQPDDLTSLVLRTDFSSEAAWETLQAAINNSGDYRNATFFSDSSFTDVSVQALVDADAAADDDDKLCHVFLAGATTMTGEEHPLLAVDLYDEPGRTFRVPPLWTFTYFGSGDDHVTWSRRQQYPKSKEVEVGSPVALAFEGLDARHGTLDSS